MEQSFGLTFLYGLGIVIWLAFLFLIAVVIWKDPRWGSQKAEAAPEEQGKGESAPI